eukprot:6177471-Prymnesium_polylepis.1
MSGWDNLERKNTRTGARVVENAKLRGPAQSKSHTAPQAQRYQSDVQTCNTSKARTSKPMPPGPASCNRLARRRGGSALLSIDSTLFLPAAPAAVLAAGIPAATALARAAAAEASVFALSAAALATAALDAAAAFLTAAASAVAPSTSTTTAAAVTLEPKGATTADPTNCAVPPTTPP